jgi:glycosyltransferase involved in cell wall biosynthesis
LEIASVIEPPGSQAAPGDRPLSFAVVIPAFNEQHTIGQVVARARRFADRIFVVDDGSRDDTFAVLQGLPVTVVRHEDNRGKAASLVSGFKAAMAAGVDAVITIDGDLQHAPEDIPRFLEEARRHPDSLVVGSRWERKGRVPALRRAANAFANFWISIASGEKIKDSQCGFRLYPRRLIETVSARHGRDACFVFESEILINAARADFPIRFVAIDPIYLPQPHRRSHYRAVKDTARIFRMVAAKILRG